MKIKELVYIVAGLVVGIAVGTLLLGNDPDTESTLDEAAVRGIVQEVVAGGQQQIERELNEMRIALQYPDMPELTEDERAAAESRIGDEFGVSHVRTRPGEMDFYRMSASEIQTWLDGFIEGLDPDSTEEMAVDFSELDTATLVESLMEINSSADFVLYLDDESSNVNNVLLALYTALIAQTGSSEEALSVCLGVDSNPYAISGPGL